MKIAVCLRRVPDVSEATVQVDETGRDIVKDKLVYTINESDNYALEEALLLKETSGAQVTVVTVGSKEATEVLRMALAKGAETAVRIDDTGLQQADGLMLAQVLAAYFRKESFDLILTGCVAQDVEDSQVGPALAQLLGLPHAAYCIKLTLAGEKMSVKRELEGGYLEVKEIPLPCVLSVQTGGNTPRYASILGIKRAGTKPIVEKGSNELGFELEKEEPKTELLRLFKPEVTSAAEIIVGEIPAKAQRVVEILKEKRLV